MKLTRCFIFLNIYIITEKQQSSQVRKQTWTLDKVLDDVQESGELLIKSES